jgi:hypothetical protein
MITKSVPNNKTMCLFHSIFSNFDDGNFIYTGNLECDRTNHSLYFLNYHQSFPRTYLNYVNTYFKFLSK